jgi:hypothetical protein
MHATASQSEASLYQLLSLSVSGAALSAGEVFVPRSDQDADVLIFCQKGDVDPPPLCEVFSVQDSMDLVTVTHTRTAQVVVVLQLRYALTETSTPYS